MGRPMGIPMGRFMGRQMGRPMGRPMGIPTLCDVPGLPGPVQVIKVRASQMEISFQVR